MNAEVKKLWTDALRSGEYPQTMGRLRKMDGYCCLGVLCELAARHKVIQEARPFFDAFYGYGGATPQELGETTALPFQVMEWAGLDSPDPEVNGFALAEWNDRKGADFNKIADMIEAEL